MQRRMSRTAWAALLGAVVLSGLSLTWAQDGGEDAPRQRRQRRRMTAEERQQRMEQFRQRMSEQLREDLGFSAEEWKAVAPLHEKVVTLQRELAPRRGFGRQGFRGRRGRGRDQGEERRERPAPPENETEVAKTRRILAETLEKEAATAEQLRTAVKDYRVAREKIEKELEQAQKALREVLNARQEAQLVLRGVLA